MEAGYGRPLDYQPGEQDWTQVLTRMDDVLGGVGRQDDETPAETSWDSDELQKKFSLRRKLMVESEERKFFRYWLEIKEMFAGDDDNSIIMAQSDKLGVTGMLGSICDEADTGLSCEPIENAELLLRLYLSSYTMDNDV